MILFSDKISNSSKTLKLLLRSATDEEHSRRAVAERVPHLMPRKQFSEEHDSESKILLFTFISYSIRAIILSQKFTKYIRDFLAIFLDTFRPEAESAATRLICDQNFWLVYSLNLISVQPIEHWLQVSGIKGNLISL